MIQRPNDLFRLLIRLFQTDKQTAISYSEYVSNELTKLGEAIESISRNLLFRMSEGEQSFAELAEQHSEGAESETGGLIEPIELGTLHAKLAELLHASQIGHVQSFGLGEWCMIIRLEKRISAQLDDQMRDRLLQDKFDAWLQEQIQQLPNRDKVWLGIVEDQAIDLAAQSREQHHENFQTFCLYSAQSIR